MATYDLVVIGEGMTGLTAANTAAKAGLKVAEYKDYRKMFENKDIDAVVCAPPNHRMIEFDAASQEFRWMAIASGDPTMLGLCQPGEDAHSYMGAAIAGVDYRELVERVHAKDKEAKAIIESKGGEGHFSPAILSRSEPHRVGVVLGEGRLEDLCRKNRGGGEPGDPPGQTATWNRLGN